MNFTVNNISDRESSVDWTTQRKHFPAADNFIYLNHAAIAPLPLYVQESINRCNKKFCEKGIVANRECLDNVEESRILASKLINASQQEIAFVKNTTQGIQIAANGIKWEKGDNIIIPSNEFPANVFPWLNLEKIGVEVRFLPVKDGMFSAEDIARMIDHKTRAVSVSAVSFSNGYRCDLEEIGQLCKSRDIFFIVDAIQALGAVHVDVKKCNIDLLSADAHKWLLGPQGIGILYVSDSILESLEVSNLGYKSMTDDWDYLNYTIRLRPDTTRFEEGTLNIMGITGLGASLKQLLEIGINTIENRVLELNESFVNGLTKLGYIIKSPLEKQQRSGILSFTARETSTEEIFEKLYKSNVVCAKRDGAIRISPHYYNNQDDIQRFLEILS